MTKYTFCENTISDLHKDAWGRRPSNSFWFHWNCGTDDAKQKIWDELVDDMVSNDKAEAQTKKDNASNFYLRIKDVCKLGASNYRTAIRWILEADELEHDQYYEGGQLVWEYNLAYRHKKLFKTAGVA
tara:strand:- start:126 stop:509 length:384 start_codon:yes stop_codon:yes gene_type:complete